jgi:hypothetical protein
MLLAVKAIDKRLDANLVPSVNDAERSKVTGGVGAIIESIEDPWIKAPTDANHDRQQIFKTIWVEVALGPLQDVIDYAPVPKRSHAIDGARVTVPEAEVLRGNTWIEWRRLFSLGVEHEIQIFTENPVGTVDRTHRRSVLERQHHATPQSYSPLADEQGHFAVKLIVEYDLATFRRSEADDRQHAENHKSRHPGQLESYVFSQARNYFFGWRDPSLALSFLGLLPNSLLFLAALFTPIPRQALELALDHLRGKPTETTLTEIFEQAFEVSLSPPY